MAQSINAYEKFVKKYTKHYVSFMITNNMTNNECKILFQCLSRLCYEKCGNSLYDLAKSYLNDGYYFAELECYEGYTLFCKNASDNFIMPEHCVIDVPHYSFHDNVLCEFDEFVYCDFLTIENIKIYILNVFEMYNAKHSNIVAMLFKHYTHHNKNATINFFEFFISLLNKCSVLQSSSFLVRTFQCVIRTYEHYAIFHAEFQKRKNIIPFFSEQMFDNYEHSIMACRVFSNEYLLMHFYKYL